VPDQASAVLNWLLGALFVLCVPLCCIANTVRWVTLDPTTYRQGFQKYQASERTGLSPAELDRIAQAFISYFLGPPGRLEPVATLQGVQRPLFNEREIHHMQDVQALMQHVFRAGLVSGLYLAVAACGLVVTQRQAGLATLGSLLTYGGVLTLALLVLVGGLSLLDFTELFVRFHELSFSNDLWMLDPSRDYLLILFPEGFWLDVTLRIALLTGLEAAVVGGAGLLLRRLAG
jgi:integral membrane protein (TIGR01906 family)